MENSLEKFSANFDGSIYRQITMQVNNAYYTHTKNNTCLRRSMLAERSQLRNKEMSCRPFALLDFHSICKIRN